MLQDDAGKPNDEEVDNSESNSDQDGTDEGSICSEMEIEHSKPDKRHHQRDEEDSEKLVRIKFTSY